MVKHAGSYVAKAVKVAKTYPYMYVRDIMTKILSRREADPSLLFSKAVLMPNDPRHIRPRLAPFPPPPVQEIVQRTLGRLAKDTWTLCFIAHDCEWHRLMELIDTITILAI